MLLDGNLIDDDHPLSVIAVSGGDGTTRHILGGNIIDADHPLAVHDATGGGVTDHGLLTGLADDDHTQYLLVAGTRALTGNLQANAHNTLDLGVTGTRFRTGYFGTNLSVGGNVLLDSDAGLLKFGASADVTFARLAAASLRVGAAPSATPVAQTLTLGEASRPGTDTNVGGSSSTIRSGLGTGTGTASSIVFQTPTLAASGSGVQSYADRLTVATAGITATVQILHSTGGSASAPGLAFGAVNYGVGRFGGSDTINIVHNGVAYAGANSNGWILRSATPLAWSAGAVETNGPDLFLFRDAANVLAQRNSTAMQEQRWYETFTDSSNYARLALRTAAADYLIAPEAAGTGTLRGLQLGTSAGRLGFYGVTAIARAVLATGAGATVDNVITALQNLGLVKQS